MIESKPLPFYRNRAGMVMPKRYIRDLEINPSAIATQTALTGLRGFPWPNAVQGIPIRFAATLRFRGPWGVYPRAKASL